MISAKLIKDLEKFGFELDFPSYSSNEERIIEILRENNQRLNLGLPLLLQSEFDYDLIIGRFSSLNKKYASKLIKEFNKIIAITNKLFLLEGIDNRHIQKIISEHSLKEALNEQEFNYYHNSFKDFTGKKDYAKEKKFEESTRARARLDVNKSLSAIFSPAKLRIMEKIFNHERLTNTELKYYYKSIAPLARAILNENMRQYLRIIDSSRKYH